MGGGRGFRGWRHFLRATRCDEGGARGKGTSKTLLQPPKEVRYTKKRRGNEVRGRRTARSLRRGYTANRAKEVCPVSVPISPILSVATEPHLQATATNGTYIYTYTNRDGGGNVQRATQADPPLTSGKAFLRYSSTSGVSARYWAPLWSWCWLRRFERPKKKK